MQQVVRLGATLVVVLALASCSSGGGGGNKSTSASTQPPLTLDQEALADTPFCNAYAEATQTLVTYRSDPSDPVGTLKTLKEQYQALVPLAPAEIKNDVDSMNQNVQTASIINDLISLSPINQKLNDGIVTWVQANCHMTFG
jgi:hypothetical protein